MNEPTEQALRRAHILGFSTILKHANVADDQVTVQYKQASARVDQASARVDQIMTKRAKLRDLVLAQFVAA